MLRQFYSETHPKVTLTVATVPCADMPGIPQTVLVDGSAMGPWRHDGQVYGLGNEVNTVLMYYRDWGTLGGAAIAPVMDKGADPTKSSPGQSPRSIPGGVNHVPLFSFPAIGGRLGADRTRGDFHDDRMAHRNR